MIDVNSKAKPLILTDEWFSQKTMKYCNTGELGRLNIRRAMVRQMRKYGLTYEQIEDQVDRFCDTADASPPVTASIVRNKCATRDGSEKRKAAD